MQFFLLFICKFIIFFAFFLNFQISSLTVFFLIIRFFFLHYFYMFGNFPPGFFYFFVYVVPFFISVYWSFSPFSYFSKKYFLIFLLIFEIFWIFFLHFFPFYVNQRIFLIRFKKIQVRTVQNLAKNAENVMWMDGDAWFIKR